MYLIHRLIQETGELKAKIVMVRKPLGSTADAIRTGYFLKVLSYFPEIEILESFHNSSSREASFKQVQEALKKHKQIDAIFCTGAEQGMGAVNAVDKLQRWNSRTGNRRIIILSNDDLNEALQSMNNDKLSMTAPYTPLLGSLGIRILLKIISGKRVPKDIITPDLPMITKNRENVFGIQTIPVQEWIPYSYGKK